jgi:hypothetical protein
MNQPLMENPDMYLWPVPKPTGDGPPLRSVRSRPFSWETEFGSYLNRAHPENQEAAPAQQQQMGKGYSPMEQILNLFSIRKWSLPFPPKSQSLCSCSSGPTAAPSRITKLEAQYDLGVNFCCFRSTMICVCLTRRVQELIHSG